MKMQRAKERIVSPVVRDAKLRVKYAPHNVMSSLGLYSISLHFIILFQWSKEGWLTETSGVG